jgi:hypothetical protein
VTLDTNKNFSQSFWTGRHFILNGIRVDVDDVEESIKITGNS